MAASRAKSELPPRHAQFDHLIARMALRFHLDACWIKAQLLAESALNPRARSGVGALGLAQFMPATWLEWWDGTPGVQRRPRRFSVFHPKRAIFAHAAYMCWLTRRCGGNRLAATAAYNWGLGRVRKALTTYGPRHFLDVAVAPYETRTYCQRITKLYLQLSRENACPALH